MKPIDIIIIGVIAAIVALVLIYRFKKKRNAKSLCDCSSCMADCPLRTEGRKDNDKDIK